MSDEESKPQELKNLLIDYFKQETLDPLKYLGRYFIFGLLGSLVFSIGVIYLSLGLMRYFQYLDVFKGNVWGSILPYGIAFVSVLLALVLSIYGLNRAKGKVS